MSARRYVRVRGGDIHRFPAFEQCNLDSVDREDREFVTEESMLRALTEYPQLACGHCFPAITAPKAIHDDDVSAD